MSSAWDNPWFCIPLLVVLNIGLAMLLVVPHGAEILFFNTWRVEPWNTIFRFISSLGESYTHIIMTIILLFRKYRFALMVACVGLFSIPVVYLLKDQIGTDRPLTYFRMQNREEAVTIVPDLDLNVGQTSFPSGHTSAGFTLCTALAIVSGTRYPRSGIFLVALGTLIGISRIFLVQHFLIDVLGGAMLGVLIAWLGYRLFRLPAIENAAWMDGAIGRKRMIND